MSMPTFKTLILIFILTVFFPYFVIGFGYGPSAACIECSLFEQSFTKTFPFLFLPVWLVFLIFNAFKWNSIVFMVLVDVYIAYYSFYNITIPFYLDRNATWTTFDVPDVNKAIFLESLAHYIMYFFIFAIGYYYINRKEFKKG